MKTCSCDVAQAVSPAYGLCVACLEGKIYGLGIKLDDAIAACKSVQGLFEPKPGLPDDIAANFRRMISKDPVLMQVLAVIQSNAEGMER